MQWLSGSTQTFDNWSRALGIACIFWSRECLNVSKTCECGKEDFTSHHTSTNQAPVRFQPSTSILLTTLIKTRSLFLYHFSCSSFGVTFLFRTTRQFPSLQLTSPISSFTHSLALHSTHLPPSTINILKPSHTRFPPPSTDQLFQSHICASHNPPFHLNSIISKSTFPTPSFSISQTPLQILLRFPHDCCK